MAESEPQETLAELNGHADETAPNVANGHQNGHHPAVPPATDHGSLRRPRWHDYTAFVLSGGTARGALQVGALKALLEHGERPDVIVGTSIGAWNGAWLARNPTLEGVAALADLWRGTSPARVLLGREPIAGSPSQAVRGMLMLTAAQRVAAGHPSLYSDAGLQQLMAKSLGTLTFEDTQVPLRVIAADITHGKRVVFDSGPLAPAILASSAIPGIFPPVRIGESVYIDGGALDNASIETALALGARRIFVVDVGYDESNTGADLWSEDPAPAPSRSRSSSRSPSRSPSAHALAAVLERTVQVVSRYQLSRALDRVPRGVEMHVISAATGTKGGSLDFERAPAWMEQGYHFACEYLRVHLPQSTPVHS